MRKFLLVLTVFSALPLASAPKSITMRGVRVDLNYDEEKVHPYVLEDPLRFCDGRKVQTAADWDVRRREIVGMFEREMFGRTPPAPEKVVVEVADEKVACAGFAVRRQLRMWFRADRSGPCVNWILYRPRHAMGRVPVIVFLNFGGNHTLTTDPDVPVSAAWCNGRVGDHRLKESSRGRMTETASDMQLPLGSILARGYAVLSACYCEVSPDPDERREEPQFDQVNFAFTGVFDLWPKREDSADDNPTALGAWAWAISRGVDYVETDPTLDARRVVATGCSRLAKAALLAASRDTRIAVCAPVQTGGGGCPLAKRDFGESIASEMLMFRHWYCKAYAKYASEPWRTMPFDQHLILASIAPRSLIVLGFDEPWFDTKGEFLAVCAAKPVWSFLGVGGVFECDWPADFSLEAVGDGIGYARRCEGHGISAWDWNQILDFSDREFKRKGLRTAAMPKGPEAWLEFMGGNVRKDGLRLDLKAIKDAGISGVQFFHIQRGGAWPECPEQIACMSEKWYDVVGFLGEECKRLGLGLTVQNCPGWSQSGGPWIDLDHCMRDIECSRLDMAEGETLRLPDVPARFRDADSDWRDVCVLAFPTPQGDGGGSPLGCDGPRRTICPVSVATNGDERIYTFAQPVTIRTMTLPGLHGWGNGAYCYHMPWRRVSLEAKTAEGWRDAVRSPLPVSNWRDYVYTFSFACDERTASVWRYRLEHDFPIERWGEPSFHEAARHTDWEAKSGRVLRSLSGWRPPVQDPRAWVDASKIVDLTGVSGWTAPAGRWTVLRFGHVNSKRVNAPAPKEATGWECDKLDPKGIEAHFGGYIGRLIEAPLKGRMRGMLVDSWECFGQTWTARMEEYFAAANGYALRRHLPALFGYVVGTPADTEKFLTDWRRTNGNLVTRNYYGRMAELAHAAGLEAYYETAFGDIIFGDLLEYWKYADAPMCEYWHPHAARAEGTVGSYAYKPVRPCASAAHVYGKSRVVAEAFTGMGIRWDEDFKNLQDTANRHFARGVTHLALQSYTHAPAPDALPPGGCMGGFNGTPFTRLQTWWKYMPEFTAWLTRCEEFLEAGLPAQDILWYLGDAVDHKPDEDYPLPEGFRADYLNHDVLTNRLAVKDGLFIVPEGTAWKVLWVPDDRFMLPATRDALDRLAAAGGKVVHGGRDALVKALSGVPKDVATEPALGDGTSEDFMWIHRVVGGEDRYFVAAGTNGWRGNVTFRANGAVSIFDPVSCERSAWRNGDVLEIPPSRSVFVEFGIEGKKRLTGSTKKKVPDNPANNSNPAVPKKELTGWTLTFPAGWGAPEKVALERLVPWNEIPSFSREARAFSGTVTYDTEFECPEDDSRLELDLGRVESIARVFVNGKAVRTLWCEPYRCDLGGLVRKGRNRLRIEVTNTWRNRVIYDLGQPEKDRKTWMIYRKNFNPRPADAYGSAGIVGPAILRYRKMQWNCGGKLR